MPYADVRSGSGYNIFGIIVLTKYTTGMQNDIYMVSITQDYPNRFFRITSAITDMSISSVSYNSQTGVFTMTLNANYPYVSAMLMR